MPQTQTQIPEQPERTMLVGNATKLEHDLVNVLDKDYTCRSICALGAKGTGKSYFCLSLVKKLMDTDKKMRLVLYAPALTSEQNGSYTFLEKYRKEGRATLWNEYDDNSLSMVIDAQEAHVEQIEGSGSKEPNKLINKLIIMFDDATAYYHQLFNGPLGRIILTTRHVRIIPIIVIHALKFGGRATVFRINVDKLIVFKLTNMKISVDVFEEYYSNIPMFRDRPYRAGVTSKKAFFHFHDSVVREQYAGLYYDLFGATNNSEPGKTEMQYMASTLDFNCVKDFTTFLKTFKPPKRKDEEDEEDEEMEGDGLEIFLPPPEKQKMTKRAHGQSAIFNNLLERLSNGRGGGGGEYVSAHQRPVIDHPTTATQRAETGAATARRSATAVFGGSVTTSARQASPLHLPATSATPHQNSNRSKFVQGGRSSKYNF
jgi:hypothetical protein